MYWDVLYSQGPAPEVTLTEVDLTWEAFDQSCPSRSPVHKDHSLDVPYFCTRALKHDGLHVAETGGATNKQGAFIAVWDDDRSTDDSVKGEPGVAGLPSRAGAKRKPARRGS